MTGLFLLRLTIAVAAGLSIAWTVNTQFDPRPSHTATNNTGQLE